MAHSDSEDEVEGIDDLDFDGRSSDGDDGNDEDPFKMDGEEDAEEGTEADEESMSEDSDNEGDDDEDDEDDDAQPPSATTSTGPQIQVPLPSEPRSHAQKPFPDRQSSTQRVAESNVPFPPPPQHYARAMSPAHTRKSAFQPTIRHPRTYTVEAICAIAHPEPTHALAASMCMSHILTGSQDGYIRDYDLYTAVNGKTFLTAPQRHHCNVVEGTMKAGQLRTWWENPASLNPTQPAELSAVYSLVMHSDALWALSGSENGHVNLFTVRHDPGRFITALQGHRGPVSSLALQHDEKGVFSAGWDGEVHQWDLNTGQSARKIVSTGAQMTTVAVRPYGPILPLPAPDLGNSARNDIIGDSSLFGAEEQEDNKSDVSFDPLFDDEPEGDADSGPSLPTNTGALQANKEINGDATRPLAVRKPVLNPRGPSLLDQSTYAEFSPDVLMTASVDGQVVLWDIRVSSGATGRGVGRLEMSEKTPPWCVSACWSADGGQIYAGRRNGTVDVWDTRQFGRTGGGTPKLLKILRNPISSGPVSCVVAFPDGKHVACASNDNIRLWNAADTGEVKSGVQFKIIPGHHGGQVSQMIVDSAARFLITASSNRGWQGDSTRTVLIHDIKCIV